ncbi:MAG: TRAP transporter substrate-binding protein [Pseudomonadota bacterium]
MLRSAFTAAAFAAALSGARAQEVTLTLAHFLSPNSLTHAQFLQPWADVIARDSDGRIAVEIFPSMTLGGKPPELYRQLRDGAADMVWTVTGYTPGVFPRVEVFELPGVHQNSAAATNVAIQDLKELWEADFEDVHPILIHVHAGNALHTRGDCIEGADDLAGLKLRTPTRTGAWLIEAMGAEPVGMPVPALPQALSTGAVDGALIPFEIVPPLGVEQLTDCSVTLADDNRFGTAVFMFAMNKDRYESLPPDLQEIIDAYSGAAIAQEVGALWDEVELVGKGLQEDSGGPVRQLSSEKSGAFEAINAEVVDRWIAEANDEGLNAHLLVDSARSAIAYQ